jgi:uncharacterized protein YjiK
MSDVRKDANGRFYVTSADHRAVLKFNATGGFVGELALDTAGPHSLSLIAGIVFGPGDSLYLFGSPPGFQVFSPSLSYVRSASLPGS